MPHRDPRQVDRLLMIFNEWLPQWEQRADANQPVQVGSSLAADDAALPMLPSSQQAWIGIIASIDHLLALRQLWATADELNAFAANTLLRSSVLTASTAVYLLDDSPGVARRERQRRAALAAITDFRDALRYHDVIQPMADGLGDEAAQIHGRTRAALVDRLTQAEETAKAKGATANQVRSGLQSYRCVQAAADLLGRDKHDPLHVTTGLMYIWQQGSADAHGRMWQVAQRSASAEARESQELTMTVTASFSDLVMRVQAAALVLNEAWRMWDLRRVNHLAG